MVIKYFLLITIIYKSIEITFDENCGENKYYNYFLFECRDIDSSNYRISILTKNIICKEGFFYGINDTDNTKIICKNCSGWTLYTNSTPDGYYCTNVTSGNCDLKDYYDDDFYGIKTNISCNNTTVTSVKYNKNFPNIQDNKNNNNLRKLASNEYFYFLEDENKYKNSDKLSTSDLFDKTSNSQKLMNLCVLKTIYESTDLTEECKEQNSYNLTENQLFEELMTSSFSYNIDYQSVTKVFFDLYIQKIYFNGTVVPELELLTNQFVLCSQTYNDENDYRHFGVVIDNNCEIDLERFEGEEEIFYELFVNDGTQDNLNLVQVPILIDNIDNDKNSKTFSETGRHLNNETNPNDWVLSKRFFLFDKQINTNYITFAKFIKFRFNMTREGRNARVYKPILEIFYATKKLTQNPDINDKVNYAYVSFQSEYFTEMKKFMNTMLGLLIAACVLVFIIVVYRVWVWIKLNPKDLLPDSWFIDLLITIFFTLCRFFGIFMFWFTLIISAYWYFFYKLQSRIFLLIPPLRFYSKYYEKFDIIFGLGCGAYILYMIYRIYRQVSFSIFFIDWEQEKEIFKNANTSDDIAVASKYRRYRGAWRMLHVANQFNALQSKRVISLYFSFCWFILLYYKCKWSYRESQVPTTKRHEHSPVNFIIRHFLASIIVIGSGAIQIIVVRFLQLWIPLKKQEFLDLCSVSNISVFILDEQLHGYYIHGQAPFGKADANLDELLRFLEEERKGKVRSRGFPGSEEDSQSYEMYISYTMRTIYDGLYYIQNEAFYAQNQPNLQKVIDERKLGKIFKFIPDLAKKGNLDYLSTYMNSVLKNKIENVSSNAQVYIKEKNMIERILCYPPDNVEIKMSNTQDILLYKDPNLSFDDVLFSGMEWEWFVMDVYLFQFWMRILDDTEIAIFLTYLIDYALAFIRKFFGEKNVAKKAVIDDRFFS